jgi:hypothetical protein
MKITRLALAAALLVSASNVAIARDPTDGNSENLAVQTMICKKLYVHKPSADTNYRPGVDVNGNAVAPADLPATTNFAAAPGDYIDVPMTVDLAKRLNQPLPEGVQMEGVIGSLRLYKDGRINYNGQDIQPQADVMCGHTPKPAESGSMPAPQQMGVREVAPAPGSQQYYAPTAVISGSTAPSATSVPVPPAPPEMAKGMAAFPNKPPAAIR